MLFANSVASLDNRNTYRPSHLSGRHRETWPELIPPASLPATQPSDYRNSNVNPPTHMASLLRIGQVLKGSTSQHVISQHLRDTVWLAKLVDLPYARPHKT